MALLKAIYEAQDEIPAEYAALYTEDGDKWVLSGVDGVFTQANVDKIHEGLRKERVDHKVTKDQLAGLKVFDGMDHDEVMAKLDRVEELEAASGEKLDDEKIDEIVQRRLARERAPLERDNKKLRGQLDEVVGERDTLKGKETERSLVKAARAAAKKAGVPDDALPDVEMAARNMLTVEEASGDIITKDGVGVTPNVDPGTWITDMLAQRPLWNPPSTGSGAAGGGLKGGFPNNPWSAEHWSITEQGQVMAKEGMEKAKNMARAAGVDVNASRPRGTEKKA